MKRSKNNGKEQPGFYLEGPDNVIIELKQLAKEVARRHGTDEDEFEKIIIALEEKMLSDLLQYGAADFMGIGKLVVCYTPDLDVEFIPNPGIFKKLDIQRPFREYFA